MRTYSECDLFVCYLIVFLYWSKPLAEDWEKKEMNFFRVHLLPDNTNKVSVLRKDFF